MAEEAGMPIVFHVGGGGVLLDPKYFANGLPVPPDFHGGAENFRSVDYMAIPTPVMQTLATMIIDGIFERHPTLMFGVIEQGAGWIPSWMRYLDSAYDAFARHEERLQKLSMRPSEYVRRQLRATPYPDRRRRLDRARGRRPRFRFSRRTIRTSKAAAIRSSVSKPHSMRLRMQFARHSIAVTSPT